MGNMTYLLTCFCLQKQYLYIGYVDIPILTQNINPPIDKRVYEELTYLCMYEVYSQHYTMCDVVKCYLKLIFSRLQIPNEKHVMSANLHMQIYLRLFHNLLNVWAIGAGRYYIVSSLHLLENVF